MANRIMHITNGDDTLYPKAVLNNMKLDKNSTANFNITNYVNGLPPEYAPLEYILFTGTQYIDTLYEPSSISNFRASCGFMFSSTPTTSHAIFGGYATNGALVLTSSWPYMFVGDGGIRITGPTSACTNNFFYSLDFSSTENAVKGCRVTNGNLQTFTSTAVPLTTAHAACSIVLGGWRTSASAIALKHTCLKMFYFKFWDNGVLVRDMLPAKRVSDSAIGMYDTVTETFYANAGADTIGSGAYMGGCDRWYATTVYKGSASFDSTYFSVSNGKVSAKQAATNVYGTVKLASDAECTAGTNTAKAVTPAGLKAAVDAAIAAAGSGASTLAGLTDVDQTDLNATQNSKDFAVLLYNSSTGKWEASNWLVRFFNYLGSSMGNIGSPFDQNDF